LADLLAVRRAARLPQPDRLDERRRPRGRRGTRGAGRHPGPGCLRKPDPARPVPIHAR